MSKANTTFRILTIHLTVIYYIFWPFLSSSGRFYNTHGKEYRRVGLPFTVNTLKYIEFRLLFTIWE